MERVTKENERVSKANLWINYCILEIKADNEPAISLPVYLSLSKNENLFYEKKQNKTKQKDKKILKKEKKISVCSPTANDSETANDPERKMGMTWTQVSGSSCRFYYYYNK